NEKPAPSACRPCCRSIHAFASSFEAVNGKDPVCGTYGSGESSRAIATSSGPTSPIWTEPCAGALLGHGGSVIRTILGPVLRPPACQQVGRRRLTHGRVRRCGEPRLRTQW